MNLSVAENILGRGGDSQQIMSSLLSGLRLSSGPYSVGLMRKLISRFSECSLISKKENVAESDLIYENLAKVNCFMLFF